MLVLHGFWSPDDGFCLWAEDSGRNVKSPSQALRTARPHPFAAPTSVVAEHYTGKPGEHTLLLPSLRSAPLDSPQLVRVNPRPPARTGPALLPWRVPVVMLDAASALTALVERTGEVRYGVSFDYLVELVTFARELAARGRVVPILERDETDHGGALARWHPVIQGRDVVTVHGLVTAMPPVCRAVPGQDDPHELVTSALVGLVDPAVRDMLPTDLNLLPVRRGRRPKRLPAVDAWLEALCAPDGRFDAERRGVDALAASLQPWERLGVDRSETVRATFRLTDAAAARNAAGEDDEATADYDEHPYDESDEIDGTPDDRGVTAVHAGPASVNGTKAEWRLEFMLQSIEDPSLLVPAEQVWADDGSLGRWLPRPQELLLGELGRASQLYPELAGGLRQARPSTLELDTDGAYHFLSVAASTLDEAGFGVLLPSWWDRRAKLGLKASAFTPIDGVVEKDSKVGRDQLCDFRWELAVGDDTLTDEEIAALAETKAPLIRLRGQWVAVDPDQLKRGLEFVRKQDKKKAQKTAAEILALAASHPDDLDTPLPVTSVDADGWLGELLDGTPARSIQLISAPEGFRTELRPYQLRGLSWLQFLSTLGLGACLADDMGLGKTVQLLALESAHRSENPDAKPTLLLCPMSVVGNWQREAAKFAPGLKVYVHHGPERLAGAKLTKRLKMTDLVVTTYATGTRDIEELAKRKWHRVVLDEAQAIKNSLSRSAKAALRLQADHRVALTGTPVENRLAELWSIMEFLNPGMLGSSELFRTRYAIPVERYGQTEPAERLRRITRPYVLRRLKTDPTIIDDLPEKIETKQYCQLTVEQASLYQTIVADMMEKIENSKGIERRGNVLAAMTKLKQVCNHPALLLKDRSAIGKRSGKIARLDEILGEILAEGEQVLCFTQFTEYAEMLLPYLAARFDTDIAYLHGGTPKKRRDELVTRFQERAGPPIFLLSLRAGGTGLNLTAANHVIHIDRWWNPAVENQATDRAFRIGQKRNVQVHKFICAGTLEEKIDEMIEEKKALAELVIRDGEGWLTELSTKDLREIFALSKEAIAEGGGGE